MITAARHVMDRVAFWPPEDVQKLEDAARQIEAWRSGEYEASADELHAVDEAIAELDSGGAATSDQVRAVFAAFHAA